MGLRRRRGIDLRSFRDLYGVDPMLEYADALRDVLDAELIEERDGFLALTRRGVLVSNEVFQAFV